VLPEIEHVILLRIGRVFASGAKADMLRSDRLSEQYATPIRVHAADGYYSASLHD
jgi:iron complex transport system ATP-binding protein